MKSCFGSVLVPTEPEGVVTAARSAMQLSETRRWLPCVQVGTRLSPQACVCRVSAQVALENGLGTRKNEEIRMGRERGSRCGSGHVTLWQAFESHRQAWPVLCSCGSCQGPILRHSPRFVSDKV